MEKWRAIRDCPNYEVSSFGSVRFVGGWRKFGNQRRYAPAAKRSLALKKNGYLQVTLKSNGRIKNAYVHRLVAQAFIPQCHGLLFVNHKDGDKENNRVENLEWVTRAQNIRHAIDTLGLCVGENHSQARLSVKEVIEIRAAKKPYDILAKKYNVSKSHIGAICRRETWKHIVERASS